MDLERTSLLDAIKKKNKELALEIIKARSFNPD
jgi:hypothetical protein